MGTTAAAIYDLLSRPVLQSAPGRRATAGTPQSFLRREITATFILMLDTGSRGPQFAGEVTIKSADAASSSNLHTHVDLDGVTISPSMG